MGNGFKAKKKKKKRASNAKNYLVPYVQIQVPPTGKSVVTDTFLLLF